MGWVVGTSVRVGVDSEVLVAEGVTSVGLTLAVAGAGVGVGLKDVIQGSSTGWASSPNAIANARARLISSRCFLFLIMVDVLFCRGDAPEHNNFASLYSSGISMVSYLGSIFLNSGAILGQAGFPVLRLIMAYVSSEKIKWE